MLYRYCLKLIGELRKEKEFRQQCCQNSTKIGERKRKRWREKEEEFRQHCYRNSFAQIPARPMSCVLKKSNCSNVIAEIGKKNIFLVVVAIALPKMGKKLNGIMAISLPKMGGKKKFVTKIWEEILKRVLRSQYFYNTFITNHRWLIIISSNLILTLRLLF